MMSLRVKSTSTESLRLTQPAGRAVPADSRELSRLQSLIAAAPAKLRALQKRVNSKALPHSMRQHIASQHDRSDQHIDDHARKNEPVYGKLQKPDRVDEAHEEFNAEVPRKQKMRQNVEDYMRYLIVEDEKA